MPLVTIICYSLAGQDTRLSHENPGGGIAKNHVNRKRSDLGAWRVCSSECVYIYIYIYIYPRVFDVGPVAQWILPGS